jgi:hypothetical protein
MLKQKLLVAAILGLALATASAQTDTSQQADVEMRRKQNEEMLSRAATEEAQQRALEEKRTAAIAAYEREHAAYERKLVREKQEREARLAREAREGQCVFKSVMSDDDLARCKAAYRN